MPRREGSDGVQGPRVPLGEGQEPDTGVDAVFVPDTDPGAPVIDPGLPSAGSTRDPAPGPRSAPASATRALGDELPADTRPDFLIVPHRRRFRIPWALPVFLALYAAGIFGYVYFAYWRTPDYYAAKHWDAAWQIIGRDEGRGASDAQLIEAYEHLLAAAKVRPDIADFHRELERLNWRFDERGQSPPAHLRRLADLSALEWQRIEQERRPIGVVGLRDRGWHPDQWIAGPRRVVEWSLVPLGVALIFFAYRGWTYRRVKQDEREEWVQEHEQVTEQLGEFRRGLRGKHRSR